VRSSPVWLLAIVGALAAPGAMRAQDSETAFTSPRFWAGLEFHAGSGTGDFGEMVEGIWGFELVGRWAPRPTSSWMYRVDLGLLTYGEESFGVCSPPPIGCRIGMEVNTSNDIGFAAIGPEFRFARDRLYLFGTVGVSYFSTSSSLSGPAVSESLLTTEHFSDAVLALRFGGGWRFLVRGGRRPVRIDVGGEYHHNGVAEYLREGDIIDHPDGSITLLTTRSEANLVTFRLGVSLGFGTGVRPSG
jgi:hypothetical protein